LSDEELMIGMDLGDNFLVEGDETKKMTLVLVSCFYKKKIKKFSIFLNN